MISCLFRPIRPRTLSQSVDLNERSRFYRLFDSLFYFIMSRSELLCYSAMVINHLTSGALLSMPLPLSIFLWAMLSSRPSRNYWITVITYTEAMIVIKYIFQFRFYPWNAEIQLILNHYQQLILLELIEKKMQLQLQIFFYFYHYFFIDRF